MILLKWVIIISLYGCLYYIHTFFYRVHIRRTDKVGTEAAFHKLDEYMVHVEQYYKYKELTDKVDKKRVYLATDEPKLFSEAKRKCVKY